MFENPFKCITVQTMLSNGVLNNQQTINKEKKMMTLFMITNSPTKEIERPPTASTKTTMTEISKAEDCSVDQVSQFLGELKGETNKAMYFKK